MTPYRSGFPIDSIPPVNPLDPDPPHQKRVYQNIVGCINWLETCTRLDIAHELIFLSSYRNSPHPQHYKEAVHALKYPTSTNEYLHSKSSSKIQAFNHFPHHHNGAFPVRMPPTYSLLRRQLGWSIWYCSRRRHSSWTVQIFLSLWFSHLPLWQTNCMEINPSKSNGPQFLWSRNHGHQWMHHRTPIPEA